MATAYAADVRSGKITEFKDYAMQCARAFGALVTMRDEPSDAEIPSEFKVADWYQTDVDKANYELESFLHSDDDMLLAKKQEQFEKAMQNNLNRIQEKRQQRKRYEDMLDKAKQYIPPSADHKEFAKFMISQIEESIEFYCSEHYCNPPKAESLEQYKDRMLKLLTANLEYSQKSLKEETDRVNSRNQWVSQLRESLK